MLTENRQAFSPAIAITGMGLITAHGTTPRETWDAILSGRTAPASLPGIESALPSNADGYQAKDLPADYQPKLPREVRYLRWAIEAALRDAQLLDATSHQTIDPTRRAIALGTTLHGMRAAGRFYRSGNCDDLNTFLAGDTLRLAIDGLGIEGSAVTTCSACSSSLGSIALGMTMLHTGVADAVIAGGYDTVSEYVWAGFNSLRLIADGPLRPFTRDRKGMKLGEGYAIVILERVEDAMRRNVPIRAILSGYGESADAHHLTQPHPAGAGALAAMQASLNRAGLKPADIGMITAHATGTPDNDASEFAAMSQLFGEQLASTPTVAFKTHIGHTLGAAGAAELVLSAIALQEQAVPPTANIDPAAIEYPGLNISNGEAKAIGIRHTLNTSLGFGGANTSIILSKKSAGPIGAKPIKPLREVVITGIGVVLPGAVGIDAFVKKLRGDAPPAWQSAPPRFVESDYEHLLSARRVRRMSGYAKLMLAAAGEACRDGKLIDDPALLASTGALLGTTHGASPFCSEYYAQIVREGVLAANPVLFAEGVPNVGAAQLSLMLGLKGAGQTIIGTRTAGLDALRLAWLRVASGEVDRLIVGAAEESSEIVDQTYAHCGLKATGESGAAFESTKGFWPTPGAIAFVIESAASADMRNAKAYARITHAAGFSGPPERLPRTLATLLNDMPPQSRWISSANATWLGAVELAALRRKETGAIGSVYDIFGEAFSVSPLIALAAALTAGSVPSVGGTTWSTEGGAKSFGVLCTDWQGNAAAVEVQPIV